MANGNIGFDDLLGLYAFGPSYGALKAGTRKRGAQKDVLDLLSQAGGLGGTVRQTPEGRGIPTGIPAGSIDPSGFTGLPAGRDVSVRESPQFQEKMLNLLATQDKLSEFLTAKPEKEPLPSFQKFRRGEEQISSLLDPRTGETIKELGRGPAFAPKGGRTTPTPSQALKRISDIEEKIAVKLKAGKGVDPLMAYVLSQTEDGKETLALYQSGDIVGAIAALERELAYNEQFVPEQFKETKKTEGEKPAPAPAKAPGYNPGDYQKYR